MGTKSSTKVYDYRYALDYALCQGPIDSINYVWVKDKRVFCGAVTTRQDLCINRPKLFGGDTSEGGVDGVIECYLGTDNQESSEHLARRMGYDNTTDESDAAYYEKAPAYPGIAHMFFRRAGMSRGGFRWGTNNPYLPGVKASVTRIPRGLDEKWAAIRPLTAVYADGEVPDQQSTNSYGATATVVDEDADNYNQVKLGYSYWNHGSMFSLWPEYWVRQGEYHRVAALDLVGICDTKYTETGSTLYDTAINGHSVFIKEDGSELVTSLPPSANIQTGKAFIRVKQSGYISGHSTLFPDDNSVICSSAIVQYADDGNGQPGAELSNINISSSSNFLNGIDVVDYKLRPECRFVKIALAVNPGIYWNGLTVTMQGATLYYPEIEYSYCNLDDSIGELPDANPAHIIYELLVDEDERGNANAVDYIDSDQFKESAETLFNEGFGLSIRQDETLDRKELIASIAEHTRGAIFQNPKDGKWNYKLFRDDYDVSKLKTLTQSDCTITSGSRRAWSECITEITVEYTDPQEESTASVTAHSDVGAAITGNRVSETRSYPYIRNSALAQQVASRDVVEASYPLWIGTLEVSRENWDMVPGYVFKLNYDDGDFQIANMILRVTDVENAEYDSRTITVSVAEDIFGITRTTYQAPQSKITDSSTTDERPLRTKQPQYMVPMSLPYAFIESLGNLDNITDDQQHYRMVLFGSIDYRLDQVQVYTRNYSTSIQSLSYSVTPCSVVRMSESMNFAVYSEISLSTIESLCPNGVTPGHFLMLTPDIESDSGDWSADMEKQSEIIELVSYNADTMKWMVKRGVFDTVPRQWASGALLWDLESAIDEAQLASEILDPNEYPYPWWGKCVSGNRTTSHSAMWKVPVNTSARNQLPTRPGNVKVNDVGPEALVDTASNSSITSLTVTWSTRNGTVEEADPPSWSDGNYTAPDGQTYTIRFRDPDNSSVVRHEASGITGTTYTADLSTIAPRGTVYVEVWAVDTNGNESFMASKNYVQIDKVVLDYQGWDYLFSQNWNGTAII